MTTRTSEDAPIQVGFLPSNLLDAIGKGRLGMTFAPGKKVRGVVTHWDRDLPTDLARLRNVYGASHLVTLLEDHELPFLHIADLFSQAQTMELSTRHFPIPDGAVPTDLPAYKLLLRELLGWVKEGQTVIVHCRGGLGRTGLVAAGVLRACGMAADQSMRLVREVRPMAIETAIQEQFLAVDEYHNL